MASTHPVHSLVGDSFLQVSLVEILQVFLVLNGLLFVDINDTLEGLSATLEQVHGFLEVLLKSELLAMMLHLVEAGEF